MSTAPQSPRDWFDQLWEEQQKNLPLLLRTERAKETARSLTGFALEAFGKQATTPDGVRALIAMGKITRMVKAAREGTQNTLDAPEPTPEQVEEFVSRLVERLKP